MSLKTRFGVQQSASDTPIVPSTDLPASNVRAAIQYVKTTVASLAVIATSGSANDLISGTVPAARMPALTGDATTVAGTVATTLATVNANVGSFGSTSAVATFTVNAKGLITAASSNQLSISTGISGMAAGVAAFLGTPSSANLAAALTDETGTGALVFATSPTLVTPALGTPASGILTNCTGLPVSTGISGLGTGVATMLVTFSSVNIAAACTDETGTGALVFGTNPTLTTPNIGAATGTSLAATGALTSSGTAGVGYATGSGGAVTQITSRTTGVTLNKTSGAITLFTAVGSATATTFVVTNSTVAVTDTVVVSVRSGPNVYLAYVSTVTAGTFNITFTAGGVASDAPVFNFAVIKAVQA